MTEKTIPFAEVGEGLWAFAAEGDPNSGVIIIGDTSVMVVEAQATPRHAPGSKPNQPFDLVSII